MTGAAGPCGEGYELQPLVIADFLRGIEEGWPEEDVARWIVCQLPRSFHARSAEEQHEALRERVPLSGTKWDALLAAVVEHVAWLHGHERPAWVDERERFLDSTWVLPDTPWARLYLGDVRARGVPAARCDSRSAGPRRARRRAI